MSNLTPQNDVLNLKSTASNRASSNHSSSKTSKNAEHLSQTDANSKNNADLKNSDSHTETESFLNSLLKSIDENNEFSSDNTLINNTKELIKPEFSESEKLAIFESSPLMEILSLLDKLKIDSTDVKLGNLSTQLSNLVKTESNLNALKNASNFKELLDIAKDLGLSVKNIKIEHLTQSLKEEFPNLNQAGFFKNPSLDSVSKELIHHKMLEITNKNSHTLKQGKDNASLLVQTLQNLDSIIKDKKLKNQNLKAKEQKNENEFLDSKNHSKNVQTQDLSDENLKNLSLKDSKENLKENKANFDTKLNQTMEKNENKTKNTQELKTETQTNFKELSKENSKENLKTQIPLKENTESKIEPKRENNLNDIKENIKDIKDSKKDSKENLKENKANFDTKLNQTMEKNENVSKIPFSKENKENSTFDSLFAKDLKSENTEDLNANHTHKDSTDELHSLVKDLSKTSQNQVKNPINTKETLQYFSQDLKEALEQYKAPITRLNITLNPSNLGEVEVTLVQRGNNLHINFNSNTNAMNLFIQNQAEFKNSLVNMGFTGLEMNFSDQNKKEQNSGQGKNKSGLKNLENADDSKVNLELVLAKYF